jgi:S1-C subfamily serine protease
MEDLIDAVNGAKVGDEMELEVERDGQTSTVTVKLGTRPDDTQPSK